MLDETFAPRLLCAALFGTQSFTVVGDHQAGSSLAGLVIESGGGSLRRGLGAAKQEAGAVVTGRLDFVLHGFAHQFRRIAIRRNGGWLPGKTDPGEQQNPEARDGMGDGIAQTRADDRYHSIEHVNPVLTW